MAKAGLKRKLLTSPEQLDTGDFDLRKLSDRGVLGELVFKEMKDWISLINYSSHHGVEKPRSTPTARRVLTNSSVDTFNLGVPNISILALDLFPKIMKMRTGLELDQDPSPEVDQGWPRVGRASAG